MDLNDRPRAFANRVQEARLRKGWTMEQLAQRAGTTRQNVSLIERGRCPRGRMVTALAEALDVDRAWLFYVTSSGAVA